MSINPRVLGQDQASHCALEPLYRGGRSGRTKLNFVCIKKRIIIYRPMYFHTSWRCNNCIFSNGHCYCKLRLLSCGHFEAKTHLKPIQNEIVQWNQNFRFEIKIPENSNIDDAKLRISVRREGAKSEVKIGYVDVSIDPDGPGHPVQRPKTSVRTRLFEIF